MFIKEKGYAHWDGELKKKKFPWMPITRYGIKLAFRKKSFRFFFYGALAPSGVFLIGIYVSERLEDFRSMIGETSRFVNINPAYFKYLLASDFLLFCLIILLLLCGAGLISDDLKYNSIQLYFSRPLKKREYFFGKVSVIVFFLFLVTLVPGLILFIMKMVFAGNLKFFASYPWLPLSIIGYSVLVTAFFSFYGLFLSSLSKNSRYVAVLIFGIYFFSHIVFRIFNGIFNNPYFSLLSIRANLQQMGAFFFNQKAPNAVPWIYSLLVLSGICVLAGFVLKKRIRGVEVVK
jgi:ABC-type transport system involved in multi-copper enzyme maturation permease subunit